MRRNDQTFFALFTFCCPEVRGTAFNSAEMAPLVVRAAGPTIQLP